MIELAKVRILNASSSSKNTNRFTKKQMAAREFTKKKTNNDNNNKTLQAYISSCNNEAFLMLEIKIERVKRPLLCCLLSLERNNIMNFFFVLRISFYDWDAQLIRGFCSVFNSVFSK